MRMEISAFSSSAAACSYGRSILGNRIAVNPQKSAVSQQITPYKGPSQLEQPPSDKPCPPKEGTRDQPSLALVAFQTFAGQHIFTQNRVINTQNACVARRQARLADDSPSRRYWSANQLTAMGDLFIKARTQLQDLSIHSLNSWRWSEEEKNKDLFLLSSAVKCINQALIARLSAKQGQQEGLKNALQEIKEAKKHIDTDLPPDYSATDKILFTVGGFVNGLSFFVNKLVPAAFFNSFNLLLVVIKGGTLLHTEIVRKKSEVKKTLKEDILIPLIQSLNDIEMFPNAINNAASAAAKATANEIKETISPAVDHLNNLSTTHTQAINIAAKAFAATTEQISQLESKLLDRLSLHPSASTSSGGASNSPALSGKELTEKLKIAFRSEAKEFYSELTKLIGHEDSIESKQTEEAKKILGLLKDYAIQGSSDVEFYSQAVGKLEIGSSTMKILNGSSKGNQYWNALLEYRRNLGISLEQEDIEVIINNSFQIALDQADSPEIILRSVFN